MATRTDAERYAAMRTQIMTSQRMDEAGMFKDMNPTILEQWHDMSNAVEHAADIEAFDTAFDALCDFFEAHFAPRV